MAGKRKKNTNTKQQTKSPNKQATTPFPQLKTTNQKSPKQNIKNLKLTTAARTEHHKV